MTELSPDNQVVIQQVQELFQMVDSETAKLKAATGLSCPPQCGKCCYQKQVDTTAIEMLPLAQDLWRTGEGERTLELIKNSTSPGHCVFYQLDPADGHRGRCSIYPFRPLICRLFGYFTVRDKAGRYVYGGCKVIRAADPDTHNRARDYVARQTHPSVITDFSMRIIGMGTKISHQMMPINSAIKTALEEIAFDLMKQQWK